ncbi:MAG: penicillin-binding protein 2 [Betaproteobacteria bacterium TMED41]|nr:MAG: penicillin-binding protein 2 [Betaproteobacteria bacterium TMED41]
MIFTRNNIKLFRFRASILALVTIAMLTALLTRLAWLQIWEHKKHSSRAEDNRVILLPLQAPRGRILDRNGRILARNDGGFFLELQPSKIENLQATLENLKKIVNINDYDIQRFKRLMSESRSYDGLPLKTVLDNREVARLVTRIQNKKGVKVRHRLIRSYPSKSSSSHLIGHIGRISKADQKQLEKNGEKESYSGFTHIGKLGVEQSYENLLRGKVGYQHIEVTAGGQMIRELSKSPPLPGKNVQLTIDSQLQKLIESEYNNRLGAAVAIEPSSGEILAFVSMPNFNPNLFIDGVSSQVWSELNSSPDKPLLNRPIKGGYPPGSTYKPFMALAALASGSRDPDDSINDPGYFMLGSHKFRDSKPEGHGVVNLHKSIVISSDTYYYKLALNMGVDLIHEYISPFGFGKNTGIDLKGEIAGILPSSQWKEKKLGKPWLQGETPSIGIGQGYNTFTIMQMAKAVSIIANRGKVVTPRLIKASQDQQTGNFNFVKSKFEEDLKIDPEWFEFVIDAMVEVNKVGTGARVMANTSYDIAGKTGTSQVFTIKQDEEYDVETVPERLRDHSLYIGFAPAKNPKVALAVIVENGGFGAKSAGPIARKIFDFILLNDNQ